ncbi:MAG: sulfite exporter TauE/SafE family protein [Flammeovirgaceae bacterium]|nr:sulfite exporter TauE/SafE family protein [Flammeovirgaceae bacterium]
MDIAYLAFGFFVIALIYSSVGFGGGSSYLALLALLAVEFFLIRSTALVCNIIVVTSGTYIFYKEGKLDLKSAWPLMVSSVPLAYLGASYPISRGSFYLILGFTLIVAAVLLWFQQNKTNTKQATQGSHSLISLFTIGGSIGLLSGLVGIGGGIFLSPLLHLMKWDDAKRISALASFFILVNSVAGLAGQSGYLMNQESWMFILPLALAVLAGGQIGSRLGARRFNPRTIKKITAVLIFVAGSKILYDII